MSDIESRLRDAMAARAAEVEPDDERAALDRITRRVHVNRRRTLTVVGIAAGVLVLVGAVALSRRDGGPSQRVNVSSNSTSSSSSTTTSSTPTSVQQTFAEQAIWPFASSGTVFTTPEAAAKSFAVDYLGMTNARLGATNDENGTKNVEVFPNARATARTVVRLVEQPPHGWVVFEARADEIQVEQPARNAALTSPMTVAGQGTAFEATLGVELRPFGSKDHVFKDIAMAGANGEIGPFSTSITPPATDQPLVLVVFESDASGQGDMIKATVIGLAAAS